MRKMGSIAIAGVLATIVMTLLSCGNRSSSRQATTQPRTAAESPLFMAIEQNDVAQFDKLVSISSAINSTFQSQGVPGLSGMTPLMQAARFRRQEMVRTLLKAGALVGAATEDGSTVLHWAVRACSMPIILDLIAAKADVNVPTRNGATPIFDAMTCEPSVLNTLLKHGADPTSVMKNGHSVLMRACDQGSLEHVQILLHINVDPNHASLDGATALLIAADRDSPEVVEALIKAGANVNAAARSGYTPLMAAAQFGRLKNLQILLSHGADVNGRNAAGVNALFFAGSGDNVQVVDELLRHGAEIHVRSKPDGVTPLLNAVATGHPEVIEALLNAGADVSVRDAQGRDVVYYASTRPDDPNTTQGKIGIRVRKMLADRVSKAP
jgi:uncharacterized protein